MEKFKISFLIPAHNEQNVIGNALKSLSNLPYTNFEVLVGLDRCSDNTIEIVKKFQSHFKSLSYFEIKSLNGKPQVIDFLIKKSKGDIIIIHDADWKFNYYSKQSFLDLISVFNNPDIGGISESYPVEYKTGSKKTNYWFDVVSQSHYFWMDYQKKFLTYKKGNYFFLKDPTMFLTNIFRKDLYSLNHSLADDFERSKNIMDKGYKIVIFQSDKMPRFISSYNHINLRDLLKQKRRTSIARMQLQKNHNLPLPFFRYTLPVIIYMLKKSSSRSLNSLTKIIIWIIINLIAKLTTIFSSLSTSKGWSLRAKR